MENKPLFTLVAGCIAILGIVIILPGIVLAIVGAVWWYNVHHFVQIAEHAEGTVIELVLRRSKQDGDMYSPVVEFTDHLGQRHEYRSRTSSNPPRFAVGDKVQMLYDRDRPDSAEINHWLYLYFGPFMCLFFGAINIVIAAILFVVARLVCRCQPRQSVTKEQE